jgi:hypothetical protein
LRRPGISTGPFAFLRPDEPNGLWSSRHIRRTLASALAQKPPPTIDLLAWFNEAERVECGSCGQNACVMLPEAQASFCLGCGAIHVDGQRIDIARRTAA